MNLWADGIHLKVRLEQAKLCLLVMIGVRRRWPQGVVALADGYRESTESWADLLRSCRRRGMTAPVLAVGDGALGFWKALRSLSRYPRAAALVSTSSPMFLPLCRNQPIPAPWRRSRGAVTLAAPAAVSTSRSR